VPLHGRAEFLSMSLVITPPAVSMPIDNGVTSTRRSYYVVSFVCPDKIVAWTAAP